MFSGASAFNQPLNQWKLNNATEMTYVFLNATSFNQPVFTIPEKNLKIMGMFQRASAFNQPITWRANKITNMEYLFDGAASFDQDISSWRDSTASIQAGHMLRNSGMSKENYCKVTTKWKYSGNLGLNYQCE